jgi:hypothetical protein
VVFLTKSTRSSSLFIMNLRFPHSQCPSKSLFHPRPMKNCATLFRTCVLSVHPSHFNTFGRARGTLPVLCPPSTPPQNPGRPAEPERTLQPYRKSRCNGEKRRATERVKEHQGRTLQVLAVVRRCIIPKDRRL